MPLFEQDQIVEAAFREGIWEVGIDVTFASGKQANNKVDWERLFVNSEDRRKPANSANFEVTPAGLVVVSALLEMTDEFAPDVLVGVPSGGQRFARAVGRVLQIPTIEIMKLRNEPGHKTYQYMTGGDHVLAEGAERLFVIEDATTEMTSLSGLCDLIEGAHGDREVAIGAVQRRDDGSNERQLPYPIDWLIELPMPNMIDRQHPTYQRWGHLAIGTEKLGS